MQYFSEPTLVVALVEIAIGLALLARAADAFVDGAARLATAARISPVLVGAVIVGFGTSAPELLVSTIAAVNGDLELGLGNIIGSNVANLSLVLGSAALLVPLYVSRSVLIREAPLSLLSVLAFAYFATGGLKRWEGIVLLIGLVASLSWVVVGGLSDSDHPTTAAPDARPGQTEPRGPLGAHLGLTGIGLVGTVLGAQLLVWGASAVADELGLSGGFVGFTLVAIGTSLPELVTAVSAARKGETELILGNLLGSNMFNSLAVGGAMAVVGPGLIDDEGLRSIGIAVMVVVAVGAWFAMATLRRVFRIEAIALLTSWLVAVALLARTAGDETAAALFGWLPFGP